MPDCVVAGGRPWRRRTRGGRGAVLVAGATAAAVLLSAGCSDDAGDGASAGNGRATTTAGPRTTSVGAPTTEAPATTTTVAAGAEAPPWAGEPLAAAAVPAPFAEQWGRAANRETCDALAPDDLGRGAGATARAAQFAGGWGVSYDLPGAPGRDTTGAFCADCGRSAFGVAGTGAEPVAFDVEQWFLQRSWTDGSRAGYGQGATEGDVTEWLAYLHLADQRCLYNVWSFLGRDHLEHLLDHLRRVRGAGA